MLAGGSVAPSSRGLELGARVGDVAGRLDVLAIAGVGKHAAGPRGDERRWALAWGWPS